MCVTTSLTSAAVPRGCGSGSVGPVKRVPSSFFSCSNEISAETDPFSSWSDCDDNPDIVMAASSFVSVLPISDRAMSVGTQFGSLLMPKRLAKLAMATAELWPCVLWPEQEAGKRAAGRGTWSQHSVQTRGGRGMQRSRWTYSILGRRPVSTRD